MTTPMWWEMHRSMSGISRDTTSRFRSAAKFVALCAPTVLCLQPIGAAVTPGEVALKDHSMSWVGDADTSQSMLMQHRYCGGDDADTIGSTVMIEADGGTLSSIGIVWAYESLDGVPNAGDPETWKWRFGFTWSTDSHLLDPWFESPGWSLWYTFETPTNPDWLTPIGMAGDYAVHYAEVDVSFLSIVLPEGSNVHATLIPDCTGDQTAKSLLAFSSGVGAVGLENDWFANAQCELETLANFDAPYPWGAFRVMATGCSSVDINCDGVANMDDLLILLNHWGPCDDCDDCPGDFNGDCVVNSFDLIELYEHL